MTVSWFVWFVRSWAAVRSVGVVELFEDRQVGAALEQVKAAEAALVAAQRRLTQVLIEAALEAEAEPRGSEHVPNRPDLPADLNERT